MPYFVFVMVAHVDHDCIRIVEQFIHLFRIHIPSLSLHAEVGIAYAIGHDLFPPFNLQHTERLSIVFNGNVMPDAVYGWDGMMIIIEIYGPASGNMVMCIVYIGSD